MRSLFWLIMVLILIVSVVSYFKFGKQEVKFTETELAELYKIPVMQFFPELNQANIVNRFVKQVMLESGGNVFANNDNKYFGLAQFSKNTYNVYCQKLGIPEPNIFDFTQHIMVHVFHVRENYNYFDGYEKQIGLAFLAHSWNPAKLKALIDSGKDLPEHSERYYFLINGEKYSGKL